VTLADDIKYHGGAWQSDWHFVDRPYFLNGEINDSEVSLDFKPENLTSIIPSIVDWLKDSGT
jgi:hypothetical protein